jgi:hypothetical protein
MCSIERYSTSQLGREPNTVVPHGRTSAQLPGGLGLKGMQETTLNRPTRLDASRSNASRQSEPNSTTSLQRISSPLNSTRSARQISHDDTFKARREGRVINGRPQGTHKLEWECYLRAAMVSVHGFPPEKVDLLTPDLGLKSTGPFFLTTLSVTQRQSSG